ncbi:MAG: hypothetical protein K5872_15870 [Rhizobiaceae bacterium]|nr:hypothetical protein [Rhizobiaceae bacterium]MCV0407701.1 hypothetical protein [Rhizobiaceae bacterium]
MRARILISAFVVLAVTLVLSSNVGGLRSPALAQEAENDDEDVNGQLLLLSPDDSIHFDRPIGIGPVPINGRSISQLVEGTPLFSPIEGLDPSLWEKTCSNCHKWTRERLCEQGKTYSGQLTRLVLRHSHPYGGPFKLALKRWAEDGCR